MNPEEFGIRHRQLAHALQSGVAAEMQIPGDSQTWGKHLRVGVNMALVGEAGIVELLVSKGLITYEEYFDFQIAALEKEVAAYEQRLSDHYGKKVTLG